MKRINLVLLLCVFLIISLACSSNSNEPEKVGEVDNTTANNIADNQEQESDAVYEENGAPEKPSSFEVGDIVEVENHTITLTSAAYTEGMVRANFLITNLSDDSISISSMLSFSAKDNEGTVLEGEYFNCGSSLDGALLPGDRLRGDVCFSLQNPTQFKIYYDPGLFSSNTVVWAFDAATMPNQITIENIKSEDTNQQVNTHDIGELINLNGKTITLNSAAISGNILQANFTVDNVGNEEITISSMISFDAKNSDGVKLDQEYFNCGSSMDGTILPGDKLKGDICWKTNGANNIKLYFSDGFLDSTIIVWQIQE